MLPTAIRIAVAAFLTSICFSLFVFPSISESQRINIDPDRFGQLALNLAEGNGYVYERGGMQVLERTPLYTFIVTGLFKVAGGFSLQAVQVLQALLHAISSFTIYLMGLRLYRERSAILAQLLFAVHPIAIWYTARIWLETTQTLVLLLVVFAMIRLFEIPSTKRAAVLGLCVGLSCLTKSILFLFPLLVLGFLWYRFRGQGVRAGIIVITTTVLVLLPWTWRNYLTTSKFLPINTSLGFNLIQGDVVNERWPNTTTMESWVAGKQRVDSVLTSFNVPWESVEGDRALTAYAVKNYFHNPFAFAWRCVANFCSFWYLSESAAKSGVFGILQIPLALMALVSFVGMNSLDKKKVLPLVVLCSYYMFINILIVGWGRYSMPLIPILLLLALPILQTLVVKRQTSGLSA